MSSDERKTDNSQATEVLVQEIQNLDENSFPTLKSIGENELFRLRGGIADSLDIIENRRVKVRSKVNIPTEQYPHINFVGKLLGPGGQTLRQIQDETRTKMAILGTGSLRDENKEKELLSSGDPKYQHLKQPLHLQIDCLAPPAEAYYNISHALAQVRRVMLPENSANPPPPWAAGQQAGGGRGSPVRGRGRGGAPVRGGGYVNPGSYNAAMSFNSAAGAPPSTSPMRSGRGGGRGRGGWAPCPPPVNGTTQLPPPAMPAQGGDCYGNGMEQYAYPDHTGYDQTQYDTTGYEDYSGAYGQTDPWGKIAGSDSRGRGRVHPYGRPAGKEETA